MSKEGIATAAQGELTTEHERPHLALVTGSLPLRETVQVELDYFNELSGSDQIPCGD